MVPLGGVAVLTSSPERGPQVAIPEGTGFPTFHPGAPRQGLRQGLRVATEAEGQRGAASASGWAVTPAPPRAARGGAHRAPQHALIPDLCQRA